MSRVSLNRRLAALIDRAEKHDPAAVRLYRMSPAVRAEHDQWRAACDALIAAHTVSGEPGAAFAAFLAADLVPIAPPRAVAEALAIKPAPFIPADATAAQAAEIYARMIDPEA